MQRLTITSREKKKKRKLLKWYNELSMPSKIYLNNVKSKTKYIIGIIRTMKHIVNQWNNYLVRETSIQSNIDEWIEYLITWA